MDRIQLIHIYVNALSVFCLRTCVMAGSHKAAVRSSLHSADLTAAELDNVSTGIGEAQKSSIVHHLVP